MRTRAEGLLSWIQGLFRHAAQQGTAIAVLATVIALAAAYYRFTELARLPAIPEEYQPTVIPDWREYLPPRLVGSPPPVGVNIVVFSDYLCSYCRSAAHVLDELQDRERHVNIYWRHYPFLAEQSRTAAAAAECGRHQGRFREIHRALFAQRDSLRHKPLVLIASDAGITDSSAFDRCLADPAITAVLEEDIVAGRELEIRGTPTVLLDSLLFLGLPPEKYLRIYIQQVQQRSSKS